MVPFEVIKVTTSSLCIPFAIQPAAMAGRLLKKSVDDFLLLRKVFSILNAAQCSAGSW